MNNYISIFFQYQRFRQYHELDYLFNKKIVLYIHKIKKFQKNKKPAKTSQVSSNLNFVSFFMQSEKKQIIPASNPNINEK